LISFEFEFNYLIGESIPVKVTCSVTIKDGSLSVAAFKKPKNKGEGLFGLL
jgi:hypothetical protein